MSTKIDVDTANEWKKYTYTFTVDQEIVDNNINFLLIGPQFGQKMTDTTDETSGKKYSCQANTVEFYVDDLIRNRGHSRCGHGPCRSGAGKRYG